MQEKTTPVFQPRIRRVGTVTMGLCLIFTGILIVLSFFVKNVDLLWLLKFSPIILIVLGTEILYHHFFSPQDTIKYDFLSILICGCLALGSLCIGVAFQAADVLGYTPQNVAAVNKLESVAQNEIYDALTGINDVREASVSLYHDGPSFSNAAEATLENMDEKGIESYLNITLNGDYLNPLDFAATACEAMQKIYSVSNRFSHITIQASTSSGEFNFSVNGRYLPQLTVENLAKDTYFEPIEAEEILEENVSPNV
ncbi:MAG: hypothetical protein PHG02_04290 [Oscillospiraceae bacterium]|nr:hypothetical protein [Oscillospiraceae bacterium]